MPAVELERTWNAVADELRATVADVTFELWLAPLDLVGRDGKRLFVRAPRHVRSFVEERYLPLIKRAAVRVIGDIDGVELVDEDWRAATDRAGSPRSSFGEERSRLELNPRYTFEEFVIGAGNRTAHAAALTVAEMPGFAYNPLFLHGPPGLGKTHLVQAIGNYTARHDPQLVVHYATIEDFTGEFVQAMRSREGDAFRARFRGADVLLLDDVQFLAQRARTKEELFHTFNALYESGHQLVLTSDRPPSELGDFEVRLRERFESGLVVELERPSVELRRAILEKRVESGGARVAGEALDELARRVSTSVRALEGALIRLVAHASLRGEDASADLVRELVGRLRASPLEPPTIAAIQGATADAFGISAEALVAADRRPAIVHARQIAIFLARELTDETLPAIGAGFGGRSHSTMVHSCRRALRAVAEDPHTANAVEKIRGELASSGADR